MPYKKIVNTRPVMVTEGDWVHSLTVTIDGRTVSVKFEGFMSDSLLRTIVHEIEIEIISL